MYALRATSIPSLRFEISSLCEPSDEFLTILAAKNADIFELNLFYGKNER